MAISAATNMSEFSGFLNPAQAAPIFEEAARQSVVQRLAQQHPLGAAGVAVPVITARPVATWVGEAGKKSATKGSMDMVSMAPKKLAAIAVNSMEVVRANPGGYVTWLETALAEAFAVAFDYAALHGLGGDGTGSGPFDVALADTTKSVEFGTGATVYDDLVSGLSLLTADHRRLRGFAFDDIAEAHFLSAKDGNDRPLFLETPLEDVVTPLRAGRLIGRPTFMGEGVAAGDIIGFGGNFRKAAWGVVGGISYAASTEASVTINGELVSAFENNLVVVRAEAEYGFVVSDAEEFVAFTEGAS